MSGRADNRKQVLREQIFFFIMSHQQHNADRPIKTSQRTRKQWVRPLRNFCELHTNVVLKKSKSAKNTYL